MSELSNADGPVGSTCASLLQRIQQDDAEAWRRLVRLYSPLLDCWLRQGGLCDVDREDVLQEVFRAAARGIRQFRSTGPGASFRGWLRTITRSKLADHHRQRAVAVKAVGGSAAQQQLNALPEPSSIDASEASEEQEAALLRRRALELVRTEFEDRTWQAFWRVTVEEHDVKDVAKDLGISTAAVRMAKSRVLKRLRDELEGLVG